MEMMATFGPKALVMSLVASPKATKMALLLLILSTSNRRCLSKRKSRMLVSSVNIDRKTISYGRRSIGLRSRFRCPQRPLSLKPKSLSAVSSPVPNKVLNL